MVAIVAMVGVDSRAGRGWSCWSHGERQDRQDRNVRKMVAEVVVKTAPMEHLILDYDNRNPASSLFFTAFLASN